MTVGNALRGVPRHCRFAGTPRRAFPADGSPGIRKHHPAFPFPNQVRHVFSTSLRIAPFHAPLHRVCGGRGTALSLRRFVRRAAKRDQRRGMACSPGRPAGIRPCRQRTTRGRQSGGHETHPLLGHQYLLRGCFPTHDQAERVAARLARLGINCVRLHHMDNHPSGATVPISSRSTPSSSKGSIISSTSSSGRASMST